MERRGIEPLTPCLQRLRERQSCVKVQQSQADGRPGQEAKSTGNVTRNVTARFAILRYARRSTRARRARISRSAPSSRTHLQAAARADQPTAESPAARSR